MYVFTVYTTLVHCVYDTCSQCQLEGLLRWLMVRGELILEWLGHPSPPLTLERGKISDRESDSETSEYLDVLIENYVCWRKRDHGCSGEYEEDQSAGDYILYNR